MPNFAQLTILDLAEAYAENDDGEGLIESEEELSERFDEQVAPLVIEEYGEDDAPALREAFNNWSDSLCSDGILHESQYAQYTYVGKYDTDD